ncbi:Sodium/calcium exchanger protein-domain-containing protein [Geranomyces variabilis]|nr:Sodium/calcium exchanger protein-domain-containing protein [Geranomyces variabilis]KAJ3137127.1 hypothetical protein HDU90_002299 [Geranomyces variabilis]
MLPLVEDIGSLGGRMAVYVVLFILSLGLLEVGADRFLDSTAVVARRIRVPQVLIALLTAGAEWEELVVVVVALVQGHPYLALGNIIGSSIANILGSFSLALLFAGDASITIDRSGRIYALAMAFVSVLVGLGAWTATLGRPFGALLLAIFVGYAASVGVGIYRGVMRAPELSDSESDSDSDSDGDVEAPLVAPATSNRVNGKRSTPMHVLLLLGGLAALSLAGYLLAGSSTAFADAAGLTDSVVGLTLVSFATTLPEKVLAVLSARRGHSGILIANTVGSNVFLLTLVLGITLLSADVPLDWKTRSFDTSVMVASSLAFAILIFHQRLLQHRLTGAAMLIAYVAYIVGNFFVPADSRINLATD